MKMYATRRNGKVVRTTTVGKTKAKRTYQSKTTKAQQRATIHDPERKQLTKREWERRGDAIKGIKVNVPDAHLEGVSLADAEAIYWSTIRLQHLVAAQAVKKSTVKHGSTISRSWPLSRVMLTSQ